VTVVEGSIVRASIGSGNHLALIANIRSSNVLNHLNITAVCGVLGSPFFGQPYSGDKWPPNGRRSPLRPLGGTPERGHHPSVNFVGTSAIATVILSKFRQCRTVVAYLARKANHASSILFHKVLLQDDLGLISQCTAESVLMVHRLHRCTDVNIDESKSVSSDKHCLLQAGPEVWVDSAARHPGFRTRTYDRHRCDKAI
jgi:hypothetical protein